MATPRDHIEEIRREKFSIGGKSNPLTEDLHHAVRNLSAELYAKDVHFLMELIQNAEDNEYPECVDPSLEFVITSRDITATGATATLLVFNNEKGFSPKNIESICSIGRSTKKGQRKRGYIGEKGIGFKSVFLITAQPYIFSNGYQMRFNEEPCSHCNVGYIVPEWVDENPTLSVIKQIYGSDTTLPTTTIVLPLKADKVKPVKQQLSNIHPEVLLFLSKIKKLSVREDNEDPRLNTVSSISISSEINFVTRKNIDAVSYLLHLSADEAGDDLDRECSYHMWRQRFPVRQENKVDRRMEVEEWVLTLAFPNGERLNRGIQSPGVYAFLPTEMVTNFPFIIQADFLLSSSRETILLDNKWNQGILDCVSSAFINAFISLVKTTENAPVSSLPRMFQFLPIHSSPYPNLEAVREGIKAKLVGENIVPCESYTEQKFFQKPCKVGRLMPSFWNILTEARAQGVGLHNISSHGRYVLSSSFDKKKFDDILNFLGVKPVNNEWYAKCIRSSNLVLGVSEDVYLKLLQFLAKKWSSHFHNTDIKNIQLLKFVGVDGDVSFCSINELLQQNGKRVHLSSESRYISWLIDWNREFRCAANCFFAPKSTQEAIWSCSERQKILDWLSKHVNVQVINVNEFAFLLNASLNCDRKLVVNFVHFLHHSYSNYYLSEQEVDHLCSIMPLVDSYGRVITQRKVVLVPASGSKWVGLIGSNPWKGQGYVELAEDYLCSGRFAGVYTPEKQLNTFLKNHLGASDIPHITPPNAAIPTVSAPLTKQNTYFLLDWIQNLKQNRVQIPDSFMICIREGSWLKISLGDSPGYRPPSQSFLISSSWGDLLQNGTVLVDIPIIDQTFYGDEINDYKEELRMIGVMFDYGEACQFMGKHLMDLAYASSLTKTNVYSILKFIRFLRVKLLSPENFVNSIKDGRWLRTSHGDKSPVGSVLYDKDWKAASQISNIPFIDQAYYGEEILSFKEELQLLGVVIGFNKNYSIVAEYLKSPPCFATPSAEVAHLVLECVRNLSSSYHFVSALRGQKFLKTNLGYKSPPESYLLDPKWGCLLQVFNSFPLIDHNFHGGNIVSYKNELKQLGAVVEFEEAAKAFARVFKQQLASPCSISKDHVLSFLACSRDLEGTRFEFPSDLKICLREAKWLRTRLGIFRTPKECILVSPEWASISPITRLPFIDDGDNYYGKDIHEYKEELKSLGVVVDFNEGSDFVSTCLYLPQDPSIITSANVFALLDCVRNMLNQKASLPEAFLKKVAQKWLKTNDGYRSPDKCLLFHSQWGPLLQKEDGPFIDEEFYGSKILSYKKELNALGVIVDVGNGGPLLASYLDSHSKLSTIARIYEYFKKFNWATASEDVTKIWIPNGSGEDGEWVSPRECVLHDKDGLFGTQLNVLDKIYGKDLLSFFSGTLGVKSRPSLGDYVKLWKIWEKSERCLSYVECCSFWGYVIRSWSTMTEKILSENVLKLPVHSGNDGILLFDKGDIFIADDLQLKDLFEQSSSHPLFVWYPQPSLPSLPRTQLLEIYSKIGVRTISESVEKEQSTVDSVELKEVNPTEISIGNGLFRLIIAFLADSLKMELQKRHEAMKRLLNITVFETVKPITMGYSLSLSSGEALSVKASRMIRWERDDSKFFTQKMDRSSGQKYIIEYATYFSEVISEGVLWENEDCICELAELIKFGFLLEFNEEAIGFLLKSKNLQLYLEDEELLSTATASD